MDGSRPIGSVDIQAEASNKKECYGVMDQESRPKDDRFIQGVVVFLHVPGTRVKPCPILVKNGKRLSFMHSTWGFNH